MARQGDLLSVEEAQRRILDRFTRLPAEDVPLREAAGRFLAEPVVAPRAVPPFANSSMDGFAIVSRDTAGASAEERIELRVSALVPAGSGTVVTIGRGECARIMTGAPLPTGADAVAPFEEVEEDGERIALTRPVESGACVRPAGQDMLAGDRVLEPGAELGPSRIAVLAALGRAAAPCTRRPVVAVLSTGDELRAPGETLAPGQIYNSNSPMLAAAVEEAGGVAIVLERVGDEREAIVEALRQAAVADLILTSGGASVGDFDHMTAILRESGEVGFWRVNVRPGKPLLFGSIFNAALIGLPGNPTSSMVTFELFARPAIRAMVGAPLFRLTVDAHVTEPIQTGGGRRTFVRVKLSYRDGAFHARPSGPQDSAMIRPLAEADGLLVVPEDRAALEAGERARVLVWRMPTAG